MSARAVPGSRALCTAVVTLALVSMVTSCRRAPVAPKPDARPPVLSELRRFPADSLAELLEPSAVELDQKISSDGRGSLRVKATGALQTIRLYEITGLQLENVQLVFQAQVRAEGTGKLHAKIMVYKEMDRTFFGRSRSQPLEQQQKWRAVEARHILQRGESPDRLELQLVIEDKSAGTVWIDDLRLLSGPSPLADRSAPR
jgi:hypothetical protein